MSNTDKDYSLGQRIYRILSGFELALICFILLFLLTLFGTIEQKWIGLYQAIERYFDIGSLFVVPQQGDGKVIFLPLPGAYLVMGVLFVNLTLGGLVRARKGWKTVGVLISHSSVLVLLAAGAVSSFSKKEGIMFVFEGQHSDFAQSYHDHTIEVFEYGDDGSRGNPAVIANEHLRGMSRAGLLKVDMQEFPFSLEVRGFMLASKVMSATRNKAEGDEEKVIDGFFLREVERDDEEELNMAGCYLTVLDEGGNAIKELLLSGETPYPVSLTHKGKRYGFMMPKMVWPMPFKVELHKSVGEYYPGTQKPSWFQSDVTKVDGANRESYEIIMNEPMRHGGYTLYQARWTPPPPGETARRSGFAIVENPSDKWPEYSLWIAIAGLLIHFLMMLVRFIDSATRSSKSAKHVSS